MLSMLLLGIELGRRTDRTVPRGLSPSGVTREEYDAGLVRLERRLESDFADAIDKLEHLEGRIRKRQAKEVPVKTEERDGEPVGSTQERARAKLAAMQSAGRSLTSVSPSRGTE